MRVIWLSLVRFYINIGFFFYFKKIHIYDVQNVPKNKPVLLLSNHQNALLDALLIATKCGRFSYYLTRAAVFKKPIVAKILKSLQMIPVYRIRDGWGNISNNNAVFDDCTALLNKNQAVVIFPEGNHSLVRSVRTLSKGFTRIILDTFEKHPDIDLKLLPVGLNFRKAELFPDEAAIYFGQPIAAKDYITGNRNADVVILKTKIQSEIAKLTTDIPEKNYTETLNVLEQLNVDFLKPKAVNDCINSGFKSCDSVDKVSQGNWLRRFFKTLLICNTILPYVIWKYIAEPKVEELEFLSTFRFAVAITLFPLYLVIIGAVIFVFLSLKLALLYIVFVLFLALCAVKL